MFMNLHLYTIFCAANAIERLQKNTTQVFSVNLFLHFSCLQINKFNRDNTLYIKTIDNNKYTNFLHEINVLKNLF